MTNKKLRRWEAALLAGAAIALLCGMYLDGEQDALAEQVIRLHVIANSDSAEDQALKLLVRDRILETAGALCSPEDSLEQVRAALEGSLYQLAQAGREVVEEQGFDYPVSASLERTWFPTRSYDGFSLPAGEYDALRVTIGEGAGQNWWCVVFPPLCLSAGQEALEQAAAAGGFTDQQVALIRGETEGYVLKFKAIELWEQLKMIFS